MAFALMVAAAIATAANGGIKLVTIPIAPEFAAHSAQNATDPNRGSDLLLYDRVIRRLQAGESYYDFIVEEQRLSGYPVTPGAAVRLPTLAVLLAATPQAVHFGIGLLLLVALTISWIYRLAGGHIPGPYVAGAIMLLILAANPLLFSSLYVLHELWAGALLALALAVHRPGHWVLSVVFAALAVSIRELALPFVFLMAAMALWRRDWREGAAWIALATSFGVAYCMHLWVLSQQVLINDPASASWLAMGGLASWLTKMILSSPLSVVPTLIASPLVICALAGWAGVRSAAGSFAILLLLGYGLAFMIAGRPENFYWGLLLTPILFMGLAFMPLTISSLFRAAKLHEAFLDMVIACKRHVLQKHLT